MVLEVTEPVFSPVLFIAVRAQNMGKTIILYGFKNPVRGTD